jgi:hypothetical protein
VLRDGFSYADWVVGTSAIRAVDEGFPAEGTALHYRIGRGPLSFDDQTKVLGVEDGRRLQLEARAWPIGTAGITITTQDQGPVTRVSIDEKPARGLAATLHNPAADLLIKVRNVEVLRRLERLACRRVSDRA